jgi:predicted transposase/invertase (TIGR01784 family)
MQPAWQRPLSADLVFHMLFGNPEHKGVCIGLLNDVLQPSPPIIEIEILNPFELSRWVGDKPVVIDLLVTDQEGRQYPVEMQRRVDAELGHRMAYGAARRFSALLKEGEEYEEVKPLISLWILDGMLQPARGPSRHRPLLRYRCYDTEAGHFLTDRFQIYALQLPVWKSQREELLRTPLGPWMYFFNESSGWTEIPPEARIPAIQEATAMMYHFTEDERQRSLLEGRLRAERMLARAERLIDRAARTEQAEERAREMEEKLEQEALARLTAEQARQEEARARLLAEQARQEEALARQELERQLEELRASIRRGTT